MNPYMKVEVEFNTANAILNTVQTIFSQEQDAPPNDEIIFWTLEGVKNELKSAKAKLLEDDLDYIHKADLFCFLESLEIENVSELWQMYQQSKSKH